MKGKNGKVKKKFQGKNTIGRFLTIGRKTVMSINFKLNRREPITYLTIIKDCSKTDKEKTSQLTETEIRTQTKTTNKDKNQRLKYLVPTKSIRIHEDNYIHKVELPVIYQKTKH